MLAPFNFRTFLKLQMLFKNTREFGIFSTILGKRRAEVPVRQSE
jgi:hypothetical protein